MAIEAVAAVAAEEVAVEAAKEAVTQAAREIAQKMATEVGAQGAGNDLQTAMMERQAMQEGFRIGEMPEGKGEGREFLKQKESDAAEELRGKLDVEEIRPATGQKTVNESSEVQNPAEKEMADADAAQEVAESQKEGTLDGEIRTLYANGDFAKNCPIENGQNGKWEGERGNSKWMPNSDVAPKKYNPEEKTWGEIFEPYNIDGIVYHDGEPDFSEVSRGTVEIADFKSEMEGGRPKNYTQADEQLSLKWNQDKLAGKEDWTPQDIEVFRHENILSWHEHPDMKTMELVPRIIHGNIEHRGGISAANQVFDTTVTSKQSVFT